MAQATGWNSVPSGVLEQILLRVEAKDCWTARQAASAWAHASRKVASFELTVAASPGNVCSKVTALNKLDNTVVYPRVHFTMKIHEPLQACDCFKMLGNIKLMVRSPLLTCADLY